MAVAILALGLLVFLAHLFKAVSERFHLPDILPLLLIGLAVGPLLGYVTPMDFGHLGGVLSTLTLVLILFQGGMGLRWVDLKKSLGSGGRITFLGFTATFAVVGLASAPMLGLSFTEGLLLGAILGGTSSVVVIPLSSLLPLQAATRSVLVLESTLTDVIGIVVTLGLLDVLKSAVPSPLALGGRVLVSFILAGAFGFAAALLWSSVLSRIRQLENNLFTTPAVAFIVFGVTELFQYSGALGTLVFGITLGNLGHPSLRGLAKKLRLKSGRLNDLEQAVVGEMVFLLKAFFFLYMGLSLRLGEPKPALVGLGLTALVYLVRLPVVMFSLPRSTPDLDRSAVRVLAPKGLAAAALAGLPAAAGLPGGLVIQDVTYAVVLLSVLFSSLAVTWLSRRSSAPKKTSRPAARSSRSSVRIPTSSRKRN